MSSAATAEPLAGSQSRSAPAGEPAQTTRAGETFDRLDILLPDDKRADEHFIPVTRHALLDRLTKPHMWPDGVAAEARRFLRYLDYWRHQQYGAQLIELEQSYEPFSPDSDLLITRTYTEEERKTLRGEVVDGVERLLQQSNYVRVDPDQVEVILTKDSHYGLDLFVDLDAFEELLIYYRGASTLKEQRRSWRKFLRKQEFDIPIFRRLFVLFKLKPQDVRAREIMIAQKISWREARRQVKKLYAGLPSGVNSENVYMKLFKNMPRSDLEMAFPNTRVKFRPFDKLKLLLTGGAGLGVGSFSAAGKIAVATSNPIAAAGAVAGLGGILFRQCVNFVNQRQRYMVVMVQNLYFHAMADNIAVLTQLADSAAEQDVKEEMLLYSVLAKETVNRRDVKAVDAAIERYLAGAFGVNVDFELDDALGRLLKDGIVTEEADGTLRTLPPGHAGQRIDALWDKFLDCLPDIASEAGLEVEASGSAPETA